MVEMAINLDARSMAMHEAIPSGMGERLQANIKGMATRPDKRSDSARHAKHKLVIVRSCVFLYTNAITSKLAETMRQERTPRSTRGRWFPCPNGMSCVLLIMFPVVFAISLEMLKNTLMFIVTGIHCSLSNFSKGLSATLDRVSHNIANADQTSILRTQPSDVEKDDPRWDEQLVIYLSTKVILFHYTRLSSHAILMEKK